jgi:hypothetical protein
MLRSSPQLKELFVCCSGSVDEQLAVEGERAEFVLRLRHSSLKAAQIDRKTWLLWVLSVRVGDFAKLALDFKDL